MLPWQHRRLPLEVRGQLDYTKSVMVENDLDYFFGNCMIVEICLEGGGPGGLFPTRG